MLSVPTDEKERTSNLSVRLQQTVQQTRTRLSIFSGQVGSAARGMVKRISTFVPGVEHLTEEGEHETSSQDMGEQGSRTSQVIMDETQRKMTKKRLRTTLSTIKHDSSMPIGVVAIHMKKLAIHDTMDLYPFLQCYHATMYVQVTVQDQIKCSKTYQHVVASSTVLMDEVHHFRMMLNNTRMDPSNFIKFELYAYSSSKPNHHKLICAKDVHIYDIIRNRYWIEPLELWGLSAEKQLACIDLEMCFAYGDFGYGYSSQFEMHNRTCQDQVSHAMFCRVEPPEGREDFESDVMLCQQTGHPCFIEFPQKAKIGETMDVFAREISQHPELETVQEPSLLITKTKKKMRKMLIEYNSQNSRRDRITYLRQLISRPEQWQQRQESADETDDHDVQALKTLADVLQKASGIGTRGLDFKEMETRVRADSAPRFKAFLHKVTGRDMPSTTPEPPRLPPISKVYATSSHSEGVDDEEQEQPEQPKPQGSLVPPRRTTLAAFFNQRRKSIFHFGLGHSDSSAPSSSPFAVGLQGIFEFLSGSPAQQQAKNPRLVICPPTPTSSTDSDLDSE